MNESQFQIIEEIWFLFYEIHHNRLNKILYSTGNEPKACYKVFSG